MSSLPGWCRFMSTIEALGILQKAAREHHIKFTNSDAVAQNWLEILQKKGFQQMPPYAREAIAKAYGQRLEAVSA